MGGLPICLDMAGMNGTQAVFTAIFTLMLLAAVFGYGTDDVNGTEARAGTTIVNNYHNNTTIEYNNTTILSEPEWFSEGGLVDVNWLTDTSEEWSSSEVNWTECEALGGTGEVGSYFPLGYSYFCDIPVTSISTESGQMLVIHERTGFSLNTTCEGVTVQSSGSTSSDEWRAPGHAMDCVHDLFINDIEHRSGNTIREPVLWSVAYSFRDVTVVP